MIKRDLHSDTPRHLSTVIPEILVKELPSRFIPYPKNIKVKYRT